MKIGDRSTARRLAGHKIKLLVVAFDPVQRGERLRIFTAFARKITRAYPKCDFGMARHDPVERVEIAVQIADGTEFHCT
jgi:hypothetical protein